MRNFEGVTSREGLWTEVTDSSYELEAMAGPSAMTNTDQTFVTMTPAMTVSDIPVNSENEVTDNMYYNFDLDTLTLQGGEIFDHSLDITCTPDGSKTVTYAVISSQANPDADLDWIEFDNGSNSLKGIAPDYDSDKNNTYVLNIVVQSDMNLPMMHSMTVEVNDYSFEVLAGKILTYAAFGIAIS